MASSIVGEFDDAGAFLLGDFTLKTGQKSPIYVDLRVAISRPTLLNAAAVAALTAAEEGAAVVDCVCGVPYGAWHLATAISLHRLLPMVCVRKEAKAHGTGRRVEGHAGDDARRCLVVEDVATTGSSILDTVVVLRAERLTVTDAVVLLDRGQGARARLQRQGVTLHSVFGMTDVLERMIAVGKLDRERATQITAALVAVDPIPNDPAAKTALTTAGREDLLENEQSKKLLALMLRKQSNLCVAADATTCEEVLKIARLVAPHVCLLKLHSDMIGDFSAAFASELRRLADDGDFMLFEDRKLADTSTTVEAQIRNEHFRIAEWADFVTVHALPGTAVLDGLRRACEQRRVAAIVVADMSCDGAFSSAEYSAHAAALAEQSGGAVAGFVCQRRCNDSAKFLSLSPGVNEDARDDGRSQRFRSCADAVVRDRNDVVIVGRGVVGAADVAAAAERYRRVAWNALLERDAPSA